MMFKIPAAGLAIAAAAFFAMPASTVSAGNLSALKSVAASQPSLLSEVHFSHRACKSGLNGWHKHVPGVGRVQCTNRKCYKNSYGITRCVYY